VRRCPVAAFLLLIVSTALFAGSTPGEQATQSPNLSPAVVKRSVFLEEASLVQNMHRYTPVVESYIQGLETPGATSTSLPGDKYFLGRLNLEDRDHDDAPAKLGRLRYAAFVDRLDAFYRLTYLSPGFMDLVYLGRSFDARHYELRYARQSFLGSVRTLVFDVAPLMPQKAAFRGRIWVEDKGYNIVRINGTYAPHFRPGLSFHFDSWRISMGPGLWLPAFVYAEQADLRSPAAHRGVMKSQTRFWGYSLKAGSGTKPGPESGEATLGPGAPTQPAPDAAANVDDANEGRASDSEVSQRDPESSQRENAPQDNAPPDEDGILNRLQSVGLLAPAGEVSSVLERVASNLLGAKHPVPGLRCRVLLTSPLETFTIGHTIVVSRGLLDVLPDEASLAMVMAHEAGHIALGHPLDTRYAWGDRLLDPDSPDTPPSAITDAAQWKRRDLAADGKGLQLLASSPYRNKLVNAGLFLRMLAARSQELPALITPTFQARWAVSDSVIGIDALVQARAVESQSQETGAAPAIAALPLGSRIKLDPWDDHVELGKSMEAPPPSARDRLAFEITPVVPSLARVRVVPELAANTH
jgi:Peptidase family M48